MPIGCLTETFAQMYQRRGAAGLPDIGRIWASVPGWWEVVMALGDGIRRNIAHIEPIERALLRDALLELNRRRFPGGAPIHR